jgi:hypothetical protein
VSFIAVLLLQVGRQRLTKISFYPSSRLFSIAIDVA